MIVTVSVPDPNPEDPYVYGLPGSRSISIIYLYGSGSGSFNQQAKKLRKPLIFTVLWLLYDFLFLKNDVKTFKKNKQKIWKVKNYFCWRLEGHWQNEQDPEPDPSVKGTDPRIRIRIQIHTKMSWIQNTGYSSARQNLKIQTEIVIAGFSWDRIVLSPSHFHVCQVHFLHPCLCVWVPVHQ